MKLVLFLLLLTASAFSKIEVHGHRGARAFFPENTIPAFEYALKQGVDILEFDLTTTRDDEIIISHNPYISTDICDYKKERTPIRSLTLSEIKKIDCGLKKNPRFPKQTPIPKTYIPTLKEFFTFIKNSKIPAAKKVQFNIETKIFPFYPQANPSPKKFVKLIMEIIKDYGMEDRVIIQSFDYRTLYEAKKISKKIRTSFLNYQSLPDFSKLLTSMDIDILSPNLEWITKEQVKLLHQQGRQVVPWTANTEKEWDYLVGLGVDGIITDDPKALINYLKKKKIR